ncbi:MAG: hypothetical protein IAB99_06120 [Bacteroidetes bacterium]|uniref:Uncharacterized protein n=1 Tax=Candidatus Cryptobacteroides faecipullorum TaxID=2840764 RepID=A0A9D9I977_9BACT|nr:hypothetical protein [Candidatus Cryptobacteroides faecipullorum]
MEMNPTWQVTAAVVDTGSCDLAVKYRKVYLKCTGGVMHIIRTEDDTDPAAAMNRPAVIAITGNGVSSKPVTDGDPSIARIMKSTDLYVSVLTGSGRVQPEVNFIRRASVSESLSVLEKRCAMILDIIVAKSAEEAEAMIVKVCDSRLVLSRLHTDIPLLGTICGQLYRKLRLPVLVAYLAVLTINWFVFSSINSRLQEKRNEYETMARNRKEVAESDSRQRELEGRFTDIPEIPVQTIPGMIAASVPDDIRLTGIDIYARKVDKHSKGGYTDISISGETFNPESIVELSGLLTGTAGFRQADILSIGIDSRERRMLKFEIRSGL